MTSSNGNITRFTGHLCREFTGPRWIPRTKASDAEFWCFSDLCPNKQLSSRGSCKTVMIFWFPEAPKFRNNAKNVGNVSWVFWINWYKGTQPHHQHAWNIAMMSTNWASKLLKSLATRLFCQFFSLTTKKTSKPFSTVSNHLILVILNHYHGECICFIGQAVMWSTDDSANTLRWRHNESDGVWNHQPHDCLFNRLFRCTSMKTSKPRVTGLCAGNSPMTGEFPSQRASNAENVSIWWRHHLVTRVCFSEPGQHGLGNSLSPDQRQAITWTDVSFCNCTLREIKIKNIVSMISFANGVRKMSAVLCMPTNALSAHQK